MGGGVKFQCYYLHEKCKRRSLKKLLPRNTQKNGTATTKVYLFQESKISIEHFRYIMQNLPKGDMTRQGKSLFLLCFKKNCFRIK